MKLPFTFTFWLEVHGVTIQSRLLLAHPAVEEKKTVQKVTEWQGEIVPAEESNYQESCGVYCYVKKKKKKKSGEHGGSGRPILLCVVVTKLCTFPIQPSIKVEGQRKTVPHGPFPFYNNWISRSGGTPGVRSAVEWKSSHLGGLTPDSVP